METRNPFGHYFIKYTNGGELPDVLKSAYTGIGPAVTAIQNYIGSMKPLRAGENKEPPELKLKDPKDQHKGYAKKPEETIFAKPPEYDEPTEVAVEAAPVVEDPVPLVEEPKIKEKLKKTKKVKLTPPVKKVKEEVEVGENLSS